MNCPKCGTENPNSLQLCISCGYELYGPQITDVTVSPKTSGLAITSLVLGILAPCTILVTSLPALIFGIVSLVKISKSNGKLKGTGLAIAGIVIPVAALPIVALLLGILMPALARVRTIAIRTVCGSNMTTLSKSMISYSADNGTLPDPDKWCDQLTAHSYLQKNVFHCKGQRGNGNSSYAMNSWLEGKKLDDLPGNIVMIFETQSGWNQAGGAEMLTTDHHQGDGCNVTFTDGSTMFIIARDIGSLKWDDDSYK